jgi:hypothetical protein
MFSIESSKQDDLDKIIKKNSAKNKEIAKEKPDLSGFYLYDTSKNLEEISQKIIQKFVSHEMDERLDVFLFLELVQTLHECEKGS